MILYQNQELYGPLPTGALHENDLTRIVLKHRAHLFPEFYAIPGMVIEATTGQDAEPDLILIDRGFQTWWLVKVAVSSQRLADYVYPKMEDIVAAVAGPDLVPALMVKEPALNEAALRNLLHDVPPNPFLLMNEASTRWTRAFKDLKVRVGVLEVFRSRRHRPKRSVRDEIYRINGDQPEPPTRVVSACRVVAPNILQVMTPTVLGVAGANILLFFRGRVTTWSKSAMPSGLMISPLGGFALPTSRNGYEIRRRGDDGLEIAVVRANAAEVTP